MPMSYPVTQPFTFQSAAGATGNGNVMDVSDFATVMMQVTGTFVGTITWEVSNDGTNWLSIRGTPDTTAWGLTTATAVGMYYITVGGCRYLRARISAWTSGAITVVGLATTLTRPHQDLRISAPADALTPTSVNVVAPIGYTFNNTNWDRQRGNMDTDVLASAARTSTTNSTDKVNYNGRGVLVTLNVTALADTPSIVLSIEAKMGAVYEALLTASAAVTATGIHSYLVYPGVGAASGDVVQVAGFPLPRTWRVTVTHGDADSITYVVNASVIL